MTPDFADFTIKARKTALVFRAINNSYRKRIIAHLLDHPQSNVTAIYCALRLEQSVASQHLAILLKSGIVTKERKAKFIFYSLNPQRINQLNSVMNILL